jgi:peroxiredoxin
MRLLTGLVAFVSLLCIATGDVAGQQAVRADLVPPKDRPAVAMFQLPDASGHLVRPSDFRGKPLVVNLWATACTGCRAELPAFVELDQTYRSRGLSVIGVSLDVMYSDLKNTEEGWGLVRPFVQTHQMRYHIVVDDGSVEKGFNVTALPATYLVDRRGRVAATYIGVVDPADLQANVKVLLDEQP